MTTSTRSTTLGILQNVVIWGVMIIPALAHIAIGHSNIRFSSLLAIYLDTSILNTRKRLVPVHVPLGTVPHIVTDFTTSITVAIECNLLRISTSTTPSAPTTAASNAPATPATGRRWSSMGESVNSSIHRSGDSLTHHGLKRHRLSWEGSLISSGKSWFGILCSRHRARVPVVGINKLLVLGLSRPNCFPKLQNTRLRDQVQCHVLCREEKFRYNLILIQGLELKCRAIAPSQSPSQAREIRRLGEPIIGKYLEEIELVITVQLKNSFRKTRQLSGGQLVLQFIQNFKLEAQITRIRATRILGPRAYTLT